MLQRFFKDYLVGKCFTFETDHLPTLGFYYKALALLSVRLQWCIIQLQQYDYNLVHIKGKGNLLPDALSRSSAELAHSNRGKAEYTVCFLLKDMPIDLGWTSAGSLQDAEL